MTSQSVDNRLVYDTIAPRYWPYVGRIVDSSHCPSMHIEPVVKTSLGVYAE